MTDNYKFHPSKDLESLFDFCRKVAIKEEKYAISTECLIYSFLSNSNLATLLFDTETKNLLTSIFYKYLIDEKAATGFQLDESIPLYVELEEILKNADYYKSRLREKEFNIIHVLMSLLSYENFTSKLFLEKGIAYINVARLTDQPIEFLD